MRLPRWLQRLLFGRQVTTRQILEYMTVGGIRAVETRSATMPPIAFFGCVDHDVVVVKCLGRADVDPAISTELMRHLLQSTKEYVDAMADYPTYQPLTDKSEKD